MTSYIAEIKTPDEDWSHSHLRFDTPDEAEAYLLRLLGLATRVSVSKADPNRWDPGKDYYSRVLGLLAAAPRAAADYDPIAVTIPGVEDTLPQPLEPARSGVGLDDQVTGDEASSPDGQDELDQLPSVRLAMHLISHLSQHNPARRQEAANLTQKLWEEACNAAALEPSEPVATR